MTFERSYSFLRAASKKTPEEHNAMVASIDECAYCAELLKKCSPTFRALLLEELKDEVRDGS